MPSTVAILLSTMATLSALAPSAYSLGCYRGGLAFNNLHGDSANLHDEVAADIHDRCNMADGFTFMKNGDKGWTYCSEWASRTYNDCTGQCIAGCNAMPRESAKVLCLSQCEPACKGQDGYKTGTNHIDWVINHDNNGDELRTITFDVCNAAFNTELGGCSTGSEQNHNGFWFRIDPNEGPCPK